MKLLLIGLLYCVRFMTPSIGSTYTLSPSNKATTNKTRLLQLNDRSRFAAAFVMIFTILYPKQHVNQAKTIYLSETEVEVISHEAVVHVCVVPFFVKRLTHC